MEINYEFRQRLRQVHKPGRRNDSAWKKIDGTAIDDSWQIVYPDDAGIVIRNAAKDLQEYFEISMDCYLKAVTASHSGEGKKILLQEGLDAPASSYRLVSDGESITVIGADDRGVAQGCYYLEDRMNLNEGPVLENCDVTKTPLYLPRMTHSGYGIDMFPEEYLKTVAHYGMDAILVFVKDLNITSHGYLDFNDTIRRASEWGIDVYAYSYLHNLKHPEDEGAWEHYQALYGQLFEKCPGLKGIVFVGESCEFPSKDPRVMNTTRYLNNYARPDPGKRYPGWFPCCDYPQWVSMVRDAIREKEPNADIVLWSYNWSRREEDLRLELIRNLPTDISLLATFELGEGSETKISDTVSTRPTDYSISVVGPSSYFEGEAKTAGERGLKVYSMTNTGGATWDVGVVPYIPAPYTWKKRWDRMKYAHDNWNLRGLMECHHYGFYPSFVAELHKAYCWSGAEDFDTLIRRVAARDYGEENAEKVLQAWRLFSEGIESYPDQVGDKYGPYRIGPAFPLLMMEDAKIPTVPYAHFGGNAICKPIYPYNLRENPDQFHYDLAQCEKTEAAYRRGADILEALLPTVPENKREEARRMLSLGRFIANTMVTAIHTKKWHMLRSRLGVTFNRPGYFRPEVGDKVWIEETVFNALSAGERKNIILQMQEIAEAEIENARRTIPLVEFDSRLGYEPSMEYIGDAEHIRWKIETTRRVVQQELLPLLEKA